MTPQVLRTTAVMATATFTEIIGPLFMSDPGRTAPSSHPPEPNAV
ncbi:hypothetical protein [Actinomadura gamaensis]|uniref:Uncharacterized protein n=1 Tax=Actinomadura gamaensis TaxID=1763541 RepID=A0ABV9UAT3_9ACTN